MEISAKAPVTVPAESQEKRAQAKVRLSGRNLANQRANHQAVEGAAEKHQHPRQQQNPYHPLQNSNLNFNFPPITLNSNELT